MPVFLIFGPLRGFPLQFAALKAMLSATKNTRRSSSRLSRTLESKRSNQDDTENCYSDNMTVKKNKIISETKSAATAELSVQSPTRKSSRLSLPVESPVKLVKSTTRIDEKSPSKTTKPTTAQEVEDPFSMAKRAFHRSGAFKIVGRVEEKAELTNFWYDNVAMGKGASIYVSGNPGTGKTALVDEIIPELTGSSRDIKLIKINCMMLKDPIKAFQEIVNAINDKTLSTSEKNPHMILNSLEAYFCGNSAKMVVLVIDEVDQIGMKDPELLCRLLALPYLPNSHISIFGIANSMDLTERFLPRLKLLNCEPKVLHFPQYTVPDITLILCDRLERINSSSSSNINFIDKSAIELTARKVASTGDLRRALDILRQAIDLAEDEYKLSPINFTGSLVKISHVVKIIEKFGNAQSGPLVLLKSLNLHQKVILASIVGYTNTSTSPTTTTTALTVQKLYEEYCIGSSRPPKLYDHVTRSEFIDLISNLESMSLIGKSTESSSDKSSLPSNNCGDIWKLKVYLLVPNELVKAMITQELPTIKALFGV